MERKQRMNKAMLAVLAVALALLAGCENPKLVTCEEENSALQEQLAQAQKQTQLAEAELKQKDQRIETLQVRHDEAQNKGLEITRTLMEKQMQFKAQMDEKDQKIKDLTAQVKQLQEKINGMNQAMEAAQKAADSSM